ncbi:MAG TPA: dihydrofolate reductase family protein [Kofleriaceae bacterium]
MRNIIQLAHISLDGFMAGPGGDMSFITMNEEIADHVYPMIDSVDTAVYGRTTYQMMESYWPGQLDNKEATAHARKHARWYMNVAKIVASRTLPASTDPKLRICKDDIVEHLAAEKRRPGSDIMIFASPTLVHTLAAHDLIDEWRINVQPVAIGGGLPLFAPGGPRIKLELRSAKTYSSGVIGTHYATKRS